VQCISEIFPFSFRLRFPIFPVDLFVVFSLYICEGFQFFCIYFNLQFLDWFFDLWTDPLVIEIKLCFLLVSLAPQSFCVKLYQCFSNFLSRDTPNQKSETPTSFSTVSLEKENLTVWKRKFDSLEMKI
jgi:hypothetical protein